MPLSDVSNAIFSYLAPLNQTNVVGQSNIPFLGIVYQSLPKVSEENQLFLNSYPGQGLGAAIYMFFTNQAEQRIAFGGTHDGRKFRKYTLGLLIVFKSDLGDTEAGQVAYNGFIDNLTEWIQADRTAGCSATSTGPYAGTGYVFQWGEGDIPTGGVDMQFDHYVPRTADGGVTIFQSVGHVTVVEIQET